MSNIRKDTERLRDTIRERASEIEDIARSNADAIERAQGALTSAATRRAELAEAKNAFLDRFCDVLTQGIQRAYHPGHVARACGPARAPAFPSSSPCPAVTKHSRTGGTFAKPKSHVFTLDENLSSLSWDGKMKNGPLRLISASAGHPDSAAKASKGKSEGFLFWLGGADDDSLVLECSTESDRNWLVSGFSMLISSV